MDIVLWSEKRTKDGDELFMSYIGKWIIVYDCTGIFIVCDVNTLSARWMHIDVEESHKCQQKGNMLCSSFNLAFLETYLHARPMH